MSNNPWGSSFFLEHPQLHLLYDSDTFVLLRLFADHATGGTTRPSLPRQGFEIVDKRSGKELFLDGAWAELFQQEMKAWDRAGANSDDIESTLDRYAQLAQNPVVLH